MLIFSDVAWHFTQFVFKARLHFTLEVIPGVYLTLWVLRSSDSLHLNLVCLLSS